MSGKILFIDDNEDITGQFGRYMELKGYECITTNTGQDGLSLIRDPNQKFDVVFLDIAMPEFSGYDVINKLEEEKLLGTFKLIILTASQLTTESREELDTKKIPILEKPITLREIISIIDGL